MRLERLKQKLDILYNQYNRRRYVHPDPLEFLYQYKEIRDREIAGLIASSLAYGRVAQILKSVAFVLDKMNPSPMHRISLALNLTKRKQANMATALEITSGFKKIVPDDPVKYDFALTRFGIRNDMDNELFDLLLDNGKSRHYIP